MSSAVLRFAPSPNGYLHLGHVWSACLAFDEAKRLGGRFLLRIEDIDQGRSKTVFEEAIYEDLRWLGLRWEEPVWRQSEHFDDYERALRQLRDMDVVYPCWATRGEIRSAIESTAGGLRRWPKDADGQPFYPGLYRDISPAQRNGLMWEGGQFAWRLNMQKALARLEEKAESLMFVEGRERRRCISVQAETIGDVVIARKDFPTSYHLSVTLDDAVQGVSLITRGHDLLPATGVHRILQELLGLPQPDYYHHELVRDDRGRRLSKKAGDVGIRMLRERGETPESVRCLARAGVGLRGKQPQHDDNGDHAKQG
ncbi:MAG: tRNA glutamyl-Q(34) synthetase GluQRS [Parvularculales bacterium]